MENTNSAVESDEARRRIVQNNKALNCETVIIKQYWVDDEPSDIRKKSQREFARKVVVARETPLPNMFSLT